MNNFNIAWLLLAILVSGSCNTEYTVVDIVNKTISSIDTVETIYYKQEMSRTNPRTGIDTIHRYREMFFQRLKQDSIVGVKGHWYFYNEARSEIIYEDIYDGQRLIRKNNLDSSIRLYDLAKHPEFLEKPFWGHNTPFGIQFSLKYMLDHQDIYTMKRLNDTSISNTECFQLAFYLEDFTSMPSFASKLIESKGSISTTIFWVDKEAFYPLRMKGESYSSVNPDQKFFIDQIYYDIAINSGFANKDIFNTSIDCYQDFEINEITP